MSLRISFTSLFILAATILKASWEPFPLGQKSFFSRSNNGQMLFSSFKSDAVVAFNGNTYLLFNSISTDLNPLPCSTAFNNWNGANPFDSVQIIADTLEFKCGYNNSTRFVTDIPVNSYFDNYRWLYNQQGIRMTRLQDSVMSFLNLTDSVRIFEIQALQDSMPVSNPINGTQIILSKNYGLVQFLPFNETIIDASSLYVLAGIANVTTGGFVQPACTDYFPYQPGDILIWHDPGYGYPYFIPEKDIRDSIVTILSNNDSIGYTVYNKTYLQYWNQPGAWMTGQYDVWYSREYLCNMANAPTDWMSATEQSNDNYSLYYISSFFPESDGSISRELRDNGIYSDSLCNILTTPDYGYTYRWNSFKGLTQVCETAWTGVCTTLVASYMNGIVEGDTSFTVGIKSAEEIMSAIYPNPAQDKVVVFSNEDSDCLIYNTTGEFVMREKLVKGKNEFNMETLSAGVYFLKINSSKSSSTQRVVKIH